MREGAPGVRAACMEELRRSKACVDGEPVVINEEREEADGNKKTGIM